MNRWDRARMAAGIANPGFPHDSILGWAIRLHALDLADWRFRDSVKADTFEGLPDADRAWYLARSAFTSVLPSHPLFPTEAELPPRWLD